jgi:large-conductance mechanosensitive channel
MKLFSHLIGDFADQLVLKLLVEDSASKTYGLNRSIESMDTEQFSIGVFYFLIVAIIVFVIISFLITFKDKGKSSKLKTGEKLLFIWIMFGVVVAVVFGAAQMMHGYLF